MTGEQRKKYDGTVERRMQVDGQRQANRADDSKKEEREVQYRYREKGGYDRGHLSLERGMTDISVDCEL